MGPCLPYIPFCQVISDKPRSVSCRCRNWQPVVLLVRQHCPDHPRHLVGECHSDEHVRLAGGHFFNTTIFHVMATLGPVDDRHCTDDQQSPNVPLPHLRRSPKPLLSNCKFLSSDQAQPSCKVSAAPEGLHWWRESLDRDGRDWSNPRHCPKAPQ